MSGYSKEKDVLNDIKKCKPDYLFVGIGSPKQEEFIIRNEKPFRNIGEPDKEHLHHQLLKLNKSTTKTVLIMYGIDILCSVISVLYALGYNLTAIVLYLLLMSFILFLIYKTDILFKHK